MLGLVARVRGGACGDGSIVRVVIGVFKHLVRRPEGDRLVAAAHQLDERSVLGVYQKRTPNLIPDGGHAETDVDESAVNLDAGRSVSQSLHTEPNEN